MDLKLSQDAQMVIVSILFKLKKLQYPVSKERMESWLTDIHHKQDPFCILNSKEYEEFEISYLRPQQECVTGTVTTSNCSRTDNPLVR